ncbi:hypothetical protein EYC84_002504 [Monilinia fructicola]|uniref:Uncharacterized protein n=1 Tax=Monilinia fructicola TaxID=38448 RepID=A0A5M9JNF3_MONFR|nr:hypothetical protein EYC84_002504 [Monilinia fructicola]
MSPYGLGRFVGMFEPHPEDRLHLRLHRARSVILTAQELVEIRAAQRTFEGAYIRTALGQFSFALVVLKIFTAEFYSIGALFATYGAGILMPMEQTFVTAQGSGDETTDIKAADKMTEEEGRGYRKPTRIRHYSRPFMNNRSRYGIRLQHYSIHQ